MNNEVLQHITFSVISFNPLNAELNTICHLLALLGAHYILHVSRIRVNVGICGKYVSNANGTTYIQEPFFALLTNQKMVWYM